METHLSEIKHPMSNRVPGAIEKTKDHALCKDLTKMQMRELLDLKHRQLRLLENKAQLRKLPDKGQKIQDLYERVVKALELKNEIDAAANLLSSLNLCSSDVNNLEWNDASKASRKEELDSDDDEDPLMILVSSSANQSKKILKLPVEDEEKLITEKDLEEIAESRLHLDPVLEQMCQKENMGLSERFLPHKFKPKSNSASSESLQEVFKKHRDNSAATPPVHSQGVKPLSLRESMELENQHLKKMKELQEQQAVERLAMKAKDFGSSAVEEISTAEKNAEANFMNKYRVTSSFVDEFESDGNDSLSDAENDDET